MTPMRVSMRDGQEAGRSDANLDSSSLGRTDRDRRRDHEPRERPARPVPALLPAATGARHLKFVASSPKPKKQRESAGQGASLHARRLLSELTSSEVDVE